MKKTVLKFKSETVRTLSMSDLHGVGGAGTSGLCPTRQANCPSVGCTYAPQPGCNGTTACNTTAGFCV